MPHKGPHISIASEVLVSQVLGIHKDELLSWPATVQDLAREITEELFLIRYNPFIDPEMVYASVLSTFRHAKPSLSGVYVSVLEQAMRRFWNDYVKDQEFKNILVKRLLKKLPRDAVSTRPNTLVECSTDATDLRMVLPMMVVTPRTTEEIRYVVGLANEMDFSLIPRGGGSGLTGGAIPAERRSVVLSMSRSKAILDIDTEDMVICVQAGVITLDAIKAAAKKNLLFTVDPASKAASSIGGNISENSGGPFAFEYGTTLDNILSYKMVTPTGEVLEVKRKDHPRHKILPTEHAVFEVLDEKGEVMDVIDLPGDQIRGKGLGKDVTNKYLGGLPGVQKEGVDGIITEGCFTCHTLPAHSRTLCLEFFGRSMHNAMLVIKDLVALRDTIREQGDLVKMSALEEFGIKYVQAIEYQKKSTQYEGDPISVLLIQLDSDDVTALEEAMDRIVDIVGPYENVDVFTAADAKQAEIFWEDRHKLSAISKRTSGFKVNEDIVIPLEVIPEFSDFIEALNLEYMARAYRTALQEVGRLRGVAAKDELINMEFAYASDILDNKVTTADLTDQELEMQAFYFFFDLKSRYPDLAEELDNIHEKMTNTRVIVANHMHAGDGNCHVNLPVDSNNPEMLRQVHEAAEKVFKKVLSLKGEVTGEHGIGITKIAFLDKKKMKAIREYKDKVDPKNVLNPGKLTTRTLPFAPYTFSFNRLIQDIRQSGLPDKDRLINLLQNIQVCTRCGKCKQVCPMFFPQASLIAHPRNKNITLGALIEAIYYSQVNRGEPDQVLLDELRKLMEHCTGCGKCTAVCPVKIDTPGVTLNLRAFLESKESGGHPIKSRVLSYLARDPAKRVPRAAKLSSFGQRVQNQLVGLIPSPWRRRFKSPLFTGKGPVPGFANLQDALNLRAGSVFLPSDAKRDEEGRVEAVYYFPGCGGSLFYRSIGLAGLMLLLKAGLGVVLPREHLCCGYPLLVSGSEEAFTTNQARNIYAIKKTLDDAAVEGVRVNTMLTACGSCRDGLQHYELDTSLRSKLRHLDVAQFLMERMDKDALPRHDANRELIYHASCHAEWTGVNSTKAPEIYRTALEELTGATVTLSPGCCGESGLGALTSPAIYNRIRGRKQEGLKTELESYDELQPILVGCPSCKVGIARSLMNLKKGHGVLHTLEYMAQTAYGPGWLEEFVQAATASVPQGTSPRIVRV